MTTADSSSRTLSQRLWPVRWLLAFAIAGAIGWVAWRIHGDPAYGPRASFALVTGAIFGVLLQRARFCWFCNLRDLFERGDARPVLGILTALAIGTLGYAAVFGGWIIDPSAGYLPPKAHIGPVSWVVAVGGLLFGIGMTLSGSCISAHLYRLGEGSLLSPVALLGVVGGFILAFRAWDWLYLNTLITAKPIWLPTKWGYAASVGAQLLVFGIIALILVRYALPRRNETSSDGARHTWKQIIQSIFVHRWPAWVGGGLIGLLGTAVLLRTQPLGVTAEISRLSRDWGTRLGWLDTRLEGLDGFAGCRIPTAADNALFSGNALFVLALVAASLAVALLAGQFRPKRERWTAIVLALIGGVLLGFGSMISLGCSIGTALSGVMAFAVSGWIFLGTMVFGVAITLLILRLFRRRTT